jgi:hypothetical protein
MCQDLFYFFGANEVHHTYKNSPIAPGDGLENDATRPAHAQTVHRSQETHATQRETEHTRTAARGIVAKLDSFLTEKRKHEKM